MKKPDPQDAVFAAILAVTGKPKPAPSTARAVLVAGKTDKPRKAAAMSAAELKALMTELELEPVDLWRPLGITDRSLRLYRAGERRISKPVAMAIRAVAARLRKRKA